MNSAHKSFFLFLIFIVLFTILSCSGGDMPEKAITYSNLKDVPDVALEKLSKKKIYFGHQSVGFNIIDGVTGLMKENPQIKLNIVETIDSSDFDGGVFAHSRVGKNEQPDTKIADFKKFIDEGIGDKADVAALKFCYIDVEYETDVNQIFDNYVKVVEKIKTKHPKLNIIHFTVPLRTKKTTWKTWLKEMLRKNEIWEFTPNIKRNEYNALLINQYKGKDPIFDIAAIESTKPDGSRQSFKVGSNTYYSLYPGYTTDGGHLNEMGRKVVAEQFLLLLVNL